MRKSQNVRYAGRILYSKLYSFHFDQFFILISYLHLYRLYYSVRKGTNRSNVVGDFSTKIAYIVELVLKIQSQCAEKEQEKILIFSQWMTILNHIAIALKLNGINFRSKFSNRDIDDFKVNDVILKLDINFLKLFLGSRAKCMLLANAISTWCQGTEFNRGYSCISY